jgi:hypothetical protein
MTRISADTEQPEARSSRRIRTPGIRPRVVLGWAGAAAVVVAGGALAAATFTAGDEGTVETPTGRADTGAPPCVWTPHVDVPVFPAENLGPAPTPDSVLVFERCDDEWTGDIAWMSPGEVQGEASRGDDGLPNPWEAGNRAIERLQE